MERFVPKDHRRFANGLLAGERVAVFTDRNPDPAYGKETIAGVTARLLRR